MKFPDMDKPFVFFPTVIVLIVIMLCIGIFPTKSEATKIYNGIDEPDELSLVEQYKSKPAPNVELEGRFTAHSMEKRGDMFAEFVFYKGGIIKKRVKYIYTDGLFGDKTETYTEGSALYKFNSSVLEYSQVSGNKFLFPAVGEAVDIKNSDTIVLPSYDFLSLKK